MMGDEHEYIFSDEEKDILQEIMNIAFGSASADLGDVIDIYVELSTPDIQVLDVGDIPSYLIERMHFRQKETSIVAQNFWGDFKGSGILVLPNKAGRNLITVLDDDQAGLDTEPIAGQEREVLMEVGNILIGACVGKVCELLETFVTYTPPRVIHDSGNEYDSFVKSFDPSQAAIIMETVFKFQKVDINGLLFIFTNQEAIEWLRKALHNFMESYE